MGLKLVLLVHILGAIVGIGPTFAFALMGAMSGRLGGQEAIGIVEAMIQIERRMVTPVALFTQPVSGLTLIFMSGRDAGFFSFEWLWIALIAYSLVLVIAYRFDNPKIEKILFAMKTGRTDTPEFNRLTKAVTLNGVAMGVLMVLVVTLMVLKPGE